MSLEAEIEATLTRLIQEIPDAVDLSVARGVFPEGTFVRYWSTHARVPRRDSRQRRIAGHKEIRGFGETLEVAVQDLLRGVKYHRTGSIE